MSNKENFLLSQVVPILLTVVIFFILSVILFVEIFLLNKFTATDIVFKLLLGDILIGMTIYLKTSVDFAIFMGNLMDRYPGWKNRVAIETGTAVGNAIGTIAILALWNIFRNILWILAIMIFLASMVLIKLAEEGMEHARVADTNFPTWFQLFVNKFDNLLKNINHFNKKILKYVVPNLTMKPELNLGFWGLLMTSISVPFILGIDNFAGYIPIFTIVNILGFVAGVFLGHMLLNIALFISPKRTTQTVKNPIISVFGSVIFVGLALCGFYEALYIFLH